MFWKRGKDSLIIKNIINFRVYYLIELIKPFIIKKEKKRKPE